MLHPMLQPKSHILEDFRCLHGFRFYPQITVSEKPVSTLVESGAFSTTFGRRALCNLALRGDVDLKGRDLSQMRLS